MRHNLGHHLHHGAQCGEDMCGLVLGPQVSCSLKFIYVTTKHGLLLYAARVCVGLYIFITIRVSSLSRI